MVVPPRLLRSPRRHLFESQSLSTTSDTLTAPSSSSFTHRCWILFHILFTSHTWLAQVLSQAKEASQWRHLHVWLGYKCWIYQHWVELHRIPSRMFGKPSCLVGFLVLLTHWNWTALRCFLWFEVIRGDVEVITEGGGRGNKAGFTGHPERTGPLCTEVNQHHCKLCLQL